MRRISLVFICLLLLGCGEKPQEDAGSFDESRAFKDIEAQVEIGPRPHGSEGQDETIQYITEELERAGREVKVQRPYRNIVATISGRQSGVVILGAHYDTLDQEGFVGANDGASGVAVLLELARSLPEQVDGNSVILVFFDKEEALPGEDFLEYGIRGSSQFAAYSLQGIQDAPPIHRIEAMILVDMVGDCDLEIPMEANSDPDLYQIFSARDSVFSGETDPISDDHIPFIQQGIPSLNLIDFTYPSWHTNEDTLDKVCPESLDIVGENLHAVLEEGIVRPTSISE